MYFCKIQCCDLEQLSRRHRHNDEPQTAHLLQKSPTRYASPMFITLPITDRQNIHTILSHIKPANNPIPPIYLTPTFIYPPAFRFCRWSPRLRGFPTKSLYVSDYSHACCISYSFTIKDSAQQYQRATYEAHRDMVFASLLSHVSLIPVAGWLPCCCCDPVLCPSLQPTIASCVAGIA